MGTQRVESRTGYASAAGRRPSNDDFAASCEGNGNALADSIAAIADGTGTSPGGRLAAETAVRGFLDGYLNQPQTLGIERAALQALLPVNRWLHAEGRSGRYPGGLVTTFTALALRGREAHVVHVGDTRVYRLRSERLECLTQDHTHPHPDLRHVLVRAVGLEDQVRVDYRRHSLEAHDRFLLCSDGVHGTLSPQKLQELLAVRESPQEGADRVVEAALAAGSQDNVTALVMDVLNVPPADRREILSGLTSLPICDLPGVGETVDGFRLEAMVSDGRYSRLFRAEDTLSHGREVILKFPHPRIAQDETYRQAFAREAWVAAQVQSPYVTEVIDPEPGRRSRLYLVMPFYSGESLEQRIKRSPPVTLAEGVDIAIKLAKGVYSLNRRRIIHRDIKPENVLVDARDPAKRSVKLVDLGVARLPDLTGEETEIPGTPSYMAPELFHGQAGDERSEVYALGVTLFRLWSGGHYPFGEIEAFSTPRFTRRHSLSRYRPDLPAWVDEVIARATAVDPAARHADAMELAFELENGAAKGAQRKAATRVPLVERNPVRFWQVVSALLALMLLVILFIKT